MKNKTAGFVLVAFIALLVLGMVWTKHQPAPSQTVTSSPADNETTPSDAMVSNAQAAEAPKLEPVVDSPLLSDAPLSTDYVLGDAHAPVTLIEYASLSCPHCAHFANDVFPELNKKYIETGKLRYILRQFPLNEPAMVGAMLVTCMGETHGADSYYTFVRVLFDAQNKWAFDQDFKASLKTFASVGGVSDKEFEACLNNTDREKFLLQSRKDASEILKVDATPYLFLNGHPHKGGQSFEEISQVIEQLIQEQK